MKTAIKEITPSWAAEILQTRNPHNRNISPRVVDKFVRDINANGWVLTHQGIAFDENGDLIDGQHRLEAIRRAGKSVKMIVTTGLPAQFQLNGTKASTFEVIDCGRNRSVGQMLALRGWKNANNVGAVVRALSNWAVGLEDWVQLSTVQAEKILFQIGPSVDWAVKASANALQRPSGAVLAPIVFYHTAHKSKAEEFAGKFFTLDNVPRKHPASALASWCSNQRSSKRISRSNACRVSASAIWHFSKGSIVEKIYENSEASEWLISQNKPLVNFLKELVLSK